LPKFSSEGKKGHFKFKKIILRSILFLRCIPQWNRTCCVAGYNEEDFFAVWDTAEKTPLLLGTTEEKLLHIMEENLSNILKLFLVISHKEGKPLLLSPTKEENLLNCGPQRRKTSLIVSHNKRKTSFTVSRNARNAVALYPKTAKN
jgi:hypothetical protein